MPSYDFKCKKCDEVFEFQKKMTDPDPKKCKICGYGKIERVYTSPNVTYPNRPPWTYKEAKKYKTAKWNDGPTVKIDPNKHGDLASWNSPGEVVPKPKPKRKQNKR